MVWLWLCEAVDTIITPSRHVAASCLPSATYIVLFMHEMHEINLGLFTDINMRLLHYFIVHHTIVRQTGRQARQAGRPAVISCSITVLATSH